jgi:hypothetical protein
MNILIIIVILIILIIVSIATYLLFFRKGNQDKPIESEITDEKTNDEKVGEEEVDDNSVEEEVDDNVGEEEVDDNVGEEEVDDNVGEEEVGDVEDEISNNVKYVKIIKDATNSNLHIAELEIYNNEDENVALQGTPTAISSFLDVTKPKNMINGITHGNYEGEDGVIAETNYGNNPWLQVELAEPTDIKKIIIYLRTDIIGKHEDTKLQLLDENKKIIKELDYNFIVGEKNYIELDLVPTEEFTVINNKCHLFYEPNGDFYCL